MTFLRPAMVKGFVYAAVQWFAEIPSSRAALTALALAFLFSPARADDYPFKPIRLIVPYAAGGGVDVVARMFQVRLGDILGQQIIVESRAGASGAVGAQIVAKSEPDGYTLLFCASDFITLPQLMPQMTFNPMKELLPVAMVTNSPVALVASADAPFNDVKGFLVAARASPKGLSLCDARSGHGEQCHRTVDRGVRRHQDAPYRLSKRTSGGRSCRRRRRPARHRPAGRRLSGPCRRRQDQDHRAHRRQRPDFVPASWPTLAESGLPIDANLWLGLFAPVGTPDAVVARLNQAIAAIVQDPEIRKRMNDSGINPEHVGPAPFAEKIRGEAARYDAIIAKAGIHFEQ